MTNEISGAFHDLLSTPAIDALRSQTAMKPVGAAGIIVANLFLHYPQIFGLKRFMIRKCFDMKFLDGLARSTTRPLRQSLPKRLPKLALSVMDGAFFR